jgi:hypothetical protein
LHAMDKVLEEIIFHTQTPIRPSTPSPSGEGAGG